MHSMLAIAKFLVGVCLPFFTVIDTHTHRHVNDYYTVRDQMMMMMVMMR